MSHWRLGDALRIVKECRLLSARAWALLGLYYVLIPTNALVDGASWLLLVKIFTSNGVLSANAPQSAIDPWLARLGVPLEPGFLLKLTIALFALKVAITVCVTSLEALLMTWTRRKLQERCFGNLLQGRWEAMRGEHVGRWVGALTEETAAFAKYLGSILNAGYALSMFAIFGGMAFAVEARVSLLLAGVGLLAWGGLRYLYAGQAELSKRQVRARQGFAADITERLEGLFQIKAAGDAEPYLRSGLRRQEEITRAEIAIGWLAGILASFNAILLCLGLLAYWALSTAHSSPLLANLGTLGSVGVLGFRALTQLNFLIASLGNLTRLVGSVDPMLKLVSVPAEPRKPLLPEPLAAIRLEQVGYDFPGPKTVLAGQTLSIPSGKVFLITGPSGSGKTTLANLIAGLYAPTRGRIVYVGASGQDYDSSSRQARIGYVTQDVRLFTGSVRDNLDPWRRVPDEELRRCLRDADAAAFVDRLGGLDGLVAEAGRSLSGGEKRRLAIARALAQKSDCLVLDEVTSGLDTSNKAELLVTIGRLGAKVLIVAIAHDVATYDVVDKTLFDLTPAAGAARTES